jgi:hypothetical protein
MLSLFQLWKRLRRRIKDRLWRLRLKLAYHLVGDKSFAANVDIVGTIHLTRMTFGAPMVRDISVFETEAIRKKERNND